MTPPETDSRRRLVLASASARRQELLEALGLVFEVRPADVDESSRRGESAITLVARLSSTKATAVRMERTEVIVAADTVVEVDGTTLGKPVDAEAAEEMLHALSGRTHRVITGVTVRAHPGSVAADPALRSAVETTSVTFAPLTADDIEWYLRTGEPLDKAGAYAVQGAAGLFVTRIDGSYDNVVGLPRNALASLMAGLGLDLRSFTA